MVVLDQDGVIQTEAVVDPSAAADGVFFQQAKSRRGLAGIDDDGPGPLHRLDIGMGQTGDAAEPSHEVQRRPLGGQDGAGVPLGARQHLAGPHHIAVAALGREANGRIHRRQGEPGAIEP